MCELIRRDEIKSARKPHRCIWCGESIDVGTPYVRTVSLNDGSGCVDDSAFHPECERALGQGAREEGGCYYFYPHEHERGGLGEAIYQPKDHPHA